MDADKKRIWLNGQFVEVSDAVYAAYTQGDRKMRYFETDLKTERVIFDTDGVIVQVVPSREDSLDRLMEHNAEQFPDEAENVEASVSRKIASAELHEAIATLAADEQALILALYFEDRTEREYAEQLGVYHNAVHKRKKRILEKLKKLLE